MKRGLCSALTAALIALAPGLVPSGAAQAEVAAEAGLSALARLDPGASVIRGTSQSIEISFALSQPVPWRVRLLDGPPRLILDTREVDWLGLAQVRRDVPQVKALRAGTFRPGWSRLVIALDGPWRIARSEMKTSSHGEAGGVEMHLRLVPASAEEFAAFAAIPEPEEWSLPVAAPVLEPAMRRGGPIVVVLDPGHGGLDPGAERDGVKEADLMLSFARELKEVLLRDGRFKVVMTREEDVFVPLEARISAARRAAADVLLSLHADALVEGDAHGVTLYTLAEDASDAAAAALAERHERDDILAGIDLSAQDDLVATVLMDMARAETRPRILRLAEALEASLREAGMQLHRKPRQEAAFSVLKSPDIPSILIEMGFLSSARDLKRLKDPSWRAAMAEALKEALLAWAKEDQVIRALRGK